MSTKLVLMMSMCILAHLDVYSETVYLKNGDRVSGEIVGQNDEAISLKTEAMGVLVISRDFLDRIESKEKKDLTQEEKKNWERQISLGYNKSTGNTESSQFSAGFNGNLKNDEDEWTVKGDVCYSSSNKKTDSQKWYGMGRYAYSFWNRKWYQFYKAEGDHDRFANIDYRIVPSTGMGYWFSDRDEWKAMVECGLGFEHTNYRDFTKDTNELNLVPRAFLEKKIYGNATISQDITLYPSLKEGGEFRMHSETALINPLNDELSLRFSLIDDYDSDPSRGIKKNDMRFISSLIYSF